MHMTWTLGQLKSHTRDTLKLLTYAGGKVIHYVSLVTCHLPCLLPYVALLRPGLPKTIYLNNTDSKVLHLLLVTFLVLNIICVNYVTEENICTNSPRSSPKTMKLNQLCESNVNRVDLSHKLQNKLVHMIEGNRIVKAIQ